MAGNVYQWVEDWYDQDFYGKSDERNPLGPLQGKYRVVRGGSWFSPATDLRTTARGPLPPTVQLPYLGFRCASFPVHVVRLPSGGWSE
jgi:formylglycine-generating enzyme required for sulfatase activity